jgi:ribonuclease HI
MKEILLFTDGSVNTKSNIGFGAYLIVTDQNLSIDALKSHVKVKRFENTSSTKLELQTLLWALGDVFSIEYKIKIYTDSQNIISLSGRRERFEKNDYITKKGELIRNHELYKEFYKVLDQLDFEIIKVHGHKVSHQKDQIDSFFTIVDRASRNALRSISK